VIAGVAVVGLALVATEAQAQVVVSGRAFPSVQSRYPTFVPTMLQRNALQNWAYNSRVVARVYRQFPPWAFGYNPYPQVISYGPVYPTPLYNPAPYYPTTPYYPSYGYPYGSYSPASFSGYYGYPTGYGSYYP
jgi:hypothetical protein